MISFFMIEKYETKKQMKLVQKIDHIILTLQIAFAIIVKFVRQARKLNYT